MRLEKNGNYWRCVFKAPDGRVCKKGLGRGTREQALARMAELDRTVAGTARVTLDAWRELYLHQRCRELAPATYEEHDRVLAELRAAVGDIPLRDINVTTARNYLATIDCQETTVRKKVRYLRTIWKHAIEQGMAHTCPWHCRPAAHPRTDSEVAYVTVETVLAIAGAAPHLASLLALTRGYGLRLHEAMEAQWDHLNSDRLIVAHEGVRTVKRRRRTVPSSSSSGWLACLRRRSTSPFIVADAGVRKDPRRNLQSAQRARGITPWKQPFHALRASCETDWLNEHPMPTVARWMGHSATVALDHYFRDLGDRQTQIA